jgi:hypothetical protein
MAADPSRLADASMDLASLYREEIYTDRKVGTLRVLIPVKADGGTDATREILYQGEAQLMTSMGPLPISFDVEARNLGEAVAGYGAAAKVGIERAMRELQEMRRQAQSSIVIPESGAIPPVGGGKIQLR